MMQYISLSPRHLALLRQIVANKTPSEIAANTGLPLADVIEALEEATSRLGASGFPEAANALVGLGLIYAEGATEAG